MRVGAGKLSRARPATRPGQAAPESGLVPPHGLPSAKFVPQSTEIGTPTVGANPTASWRAMATLTHVDRSEGLAPGEGCQQVAEEGPITVASPGQTRATGLGMPRAGLEARRPPPDRRG